MKKIFDLLRSRATICGFTALVLIAFAFRNSIAERDLRKLENTAQCRFAPFLLESAVMYSYINKVADGQSIAGVDPSLPAVKHLPAAEQMSLSLEYAGGYLLQLRRIFCGVPDSGEYEKSYEESRFIRYMLSWYLALVPAFIFLLLRLLKVPPLLALLGASVNIFSAAALGRYTGQDLIKGAFALPLLAAFLACYAGSMCCKYRGRRLSQIAGAVFAAAAAASWDAAQFTIGLLALTEILRAFISNTVSRKRRDFWLLVHISLTLVALLVPYHRAHGFIFSPTMLGVLPAAWLLNMLPEQRRRIWQISTVILLTVISFTAVEFSPFAGNYEHFGALLQAKLRFANQLPADPGLMTFDQRYLWTPELHSATYPITRLIFPAALPLLALVLAVLTIQLYLRKKKLKHLPLRVRNDRTYLAQFVLLTVISFVLYIFMMRFRDLTMLFGAIALPLALNMLITKRPPAAWRIALTVILLLAVLIEWRASRHIQRGYPETVAQSAELIKFLRQHRLANKTILADMQTSTFVKGYTDGSILIQAKYELPEIRRLTQEFVLKLFNAPQKEFVKFCTANHVDYFLLHVPILTTPVTEPYSYRYMAARKSLLPGTMAHSLLYRPGRLKNFYEITLPPAISSTYGYRLYKFIPPQRREYAESLAEKALQKYYSGQRKTARKLIRKAYITAPGTGMIYEYYVQICKKLPPRIKLPAGQKKVSAQR